MCTSSVGTLANRAAASRGISCSKQHRFDTGLSDDKVCHRRLGFNPEPETQLRSTAAYLQFSNFSLLMRSLRVATSRVGRGVRPGRSRRNPSNSCCTTCICSLAAACRCCPAVTSLCDAARSPLRALTSSYIQAASIELNETENYSKMQPDHLSKP